MKTLTKLRGSNMNSLEKYDHSRHVAVVAGEATFSPTILVFSTNPYENVVGSIKEEHERASRNQKIFYSILALTTIALLSATFSNGRSLTATILLGSMVVAVLGLFLDFGFSMGESQQGSGWHCIEIPFEYNHRGLGYLTREDISCVISTYLHDPSIILTVIWDVADRRYKSVLEDHGKRVEKAVERGYENISPKTVLRKELEEHFEESMENAVKVS